MGSLLSSLLHIGCATTFIAMAEVDDEKELWNRSPNLDDNKRNAENDHGF